MAILIPLWLYNNTGAVQFGYRYILDVIPFMIILLAAGMQESVSFLEKMTVSASVFANFAGLLWLYVYAPNVKYNLFQMWIKTISIFLHK
jgi:hypothetical protein